VERKSSSKTNRQPRLNPSQAEALAETQKRLRGLGRGLESLAAEFRRDLTQVLQAQRALEDSVAKEQRRVGEICLGTVPLDDEEALVNLADAAAEEVLLLGHGLAFFPDVVEAKVYANAVLATLVACRQLSGQEKK